VVEYRAASDEILVDGALIQLDEGMTIALAGGGQVTRNQGISATDLDGSIVDIKDFGSYLNIKLRLSGYLSGNTEGLLGNNDGDSSNELQKRDGSLATDIDSFVADWRLLDSESLFTYAPGESTATYTGIQDCGIHLSDIDLAGARQICIAQFGETACDDAKVLAIATDLAAGMTVQEVAEWTGDLLPAFGTTATRWYQDADADGYGNASAYLDAVTQPVGYVSDDSDCNDTNVSVHPGSPEICDGIDNNCNGAVDDGCGYINLTGDWDMHHTITGNTAGCGPVTCVGNGVMQIVQQGTTLPASFTITDYSGTQDCGGGSIPFSGTGTGTIDSQGNITVGVIGFSSGCTVSLPSAGSSDGRTIIFGFSGADLSCPDPCGAGSGDGSFAGMHRDALVETFDSSVINETRWQVYGPPEKGEVWQDERLFIRKQAGQGTLGLGISSKFSLEGDFDLRVDWRIEQIQSTGWDTEMRLGVDFAGGDWSITMRDARWGYSFCYGSGCIRFGSTTDMEGVLRLTRNGDTVRSFFGPIGATGPGDFTQIGSGHVVSNPGAGALDVRLDLFAYGINDSFLGSFDNFRVVYGTIVGGSWI